MINKIKELDIEKHIKEFLGEEGINFLKECKKNGKFYIGYYSFMYGGIGTQVRNYIRSKFPIIDELMTYQEYEDYTTDIVIKIIEDEQD